MPAPLSPLLIKMEKAQAGEGCAFFLLSIFRIAIWRGLTGQISGLYISMRFSNLHGRARVLPLDKISSCESAG
jgi:hypothetical protein